jgi:peroxiredoxin Q/BCP
MLNLGDKLPELSVKNQEDKEVSLSTFLGKKLAVYFYPKDDTPGCTAQACSIQNGEQELIKNGVAVVGVSADTVASHNKFATKHRLAFPLLSDTEKTLIEAFGVWGPKKFMGKTYDGIHRKTFLFNESGELIHVIDKPDTKNHAEEILKIFGQF